MSAIDRLRPTIKLTAPDGTAFEAKWIGDDVSAEKNLGRFRHPGVDGETAQDLSMGAFDYPLTLYFDDLDHDLMTQKFERALYQRGVWTVIHPVRGTKKLQPVKFSSGVKPVENVLHTVITSMWFEPAPSNASTTDAASAVDAQSAQTNASAAAQFGAQAAAAFDQAQAMVNAIQQGLKAISRTINAATSYATGIYTQIQSALSETVLDLAGIAGAVQALIQTPGLVVGDATSKLQTWQSWADQFLATGPSSNSAADINTASGTELLATAAVTAACLDILTVDIQTREQAIACINALLALRDSVVSGLDGFQALFDDLGIDRQYFSQSQSYAELARLVALACAYLLGLSTSLKVARTFTLDRPRFALEIAVNEYGQNGWDDTLFDFFLATNKITGRGICLLPAGTEVTVYG